jgi:hypothetical protein
MFTVEYRRLHGFDGESTACVLRLRCKESDPKVKRQLTLSRRCCSYCSLCACCGVLSQLCVSTSPDCNGGVACRRNRSPMPRSLTCFQGRKANESPVSRCIADLRPWSPVCTLSAGKASLTDVSYRPIVCLPYNDVSGNVTASCRHVVQQTQLVTGHIPYSFTGCWNACALVMVQYRSAQHLMRTQVN